MGHASRTTTTAAATKVSTKHTTDGPVTVDVRIEATVTVSGTIWVSRPESR